MTGWLPGERAPTAGLPPHLADLFGLGRGDDGLQQSICRLTGAAEALLLSSGTACLFTVFEHLRRGSDRRTVIVPAYTCPLVVMAARQAGLKVIACDVSPTRFDLDLDQLARLIDRDTLCVVPTHYGGWLTDVAAVRNSIAARDGAVAIVEDAAQAFGASWDGRSVGLAGDVGMFSFAAGKGLTLFEGGALVAADGGQIEALRGTSRPLIRPAPLIEAQMSTLLAGYHLLYNRIGIQLVYGAPKRSSLARGDDISAAGDRFAGPIRVHSVGGWRRGVASRALPRLPAHLVAVRASFDRLAGALAARCPGLDVHVPAAPARPSATFLFATLPAAPATAGIIDRLWRSRLGIAKQFTRAIGDYPYLAGDLLPSPTPNARDLAARTVTISTSADLGERDIETIVQAIREGSA